MNDSITSLPSFHAAEAAVGCAERSVSFTVLYENFPKPARSCSVGPYPAVGTAGGTFRPRYGDARLHAGAPSQLCGDPAGAERLPRKAVTRGKKVFRT